MDALPTDSESQQHHGKARGGGRRNKPLQPDPDQQFFSRGAQLQILRDCQLPAAEKIRGSMLKCVLRVIDDHAGRNVEAWPSQETIAAEASISYRQAQRAIAVLVELSLLCVRRVPLADGGRGGCRNHYRIVWNEVALRCPRQLAHSDQHAPGGVLVATDLRAPGDRPTRPPEPTYMSPGAQEAPKKRPRTDHHRKNASDASTNLLADWVAVVNEFQGRQGSVEVRAIEAKAAGMTPAAFRERVATACATVDLPENSGKFASPGGAVDWFLQKGFWPCSGVVELTDVDKVRAERRQTQVAMRRDELNDELSRIVLAGRGSKLTNEALTALIRSRLPAKFCDEAGWRAEPAHPSAR